MLGWLRRRRLSGQARRRLLIALARAEEELIATHVQNALDLLDAVGDEVTLERVLDLYFDAIELNEPDATIVAQAVIARLAKR